MYSASMPIWFRAAVATAVIALVVVGVMTWTPLIVYSIRYWFG